jgi:NADPH-dependent 2,4-dienoyl-CoA reductase/sulfur reductase-like enzyme
MNTGQFACSINPETGREAEVKFAVPATGRKKVLVAGGGIAGMQAALTSAERGHEVILCERSGRLGGALLCEEKVSFKEKLSDYLRDRAEEVRRSGVDIRLNTEVTPEYARSIAPDIIFAALGARPVVPDIPGVSGDNVISAEAAYADDANTGDKVAVLGAGLVGTELAIHLAMQGKKVTIIEMLDKVNDGGNFQHIRAVNVELKRYGIALHLSTKALEISAAGVRCERDGSELFIEADTVVYAVGQSPLFEAAAALSSSVPEFYALGDCVQPKNIMSATSAAYEIARFAGR